MSIHLFVTNASGKIRKLAKSHSIFHHNYLCFMIFLWTHGDIIDSSSCAKSLILALREYDQSMNMMNYKECLIWPGWTVNTIVGCICLAQTQMKQLCLGFNCFYSFLRIFYIQGDDISYDEVYDIIFPANSRASILIMP